MSDNGPYSVTSYSEYLARLKHQFFLLYNFDKLLVVLCGFAAAVMRPKRLIRFCFRSSDVQP